MVTVNPSPVTLDPALIEAYRSIAPADLGHILESGMDPEVRPVWRPVKLVGPALTVQTTPDVVAAIGEALSVARPGDVLVVHEVGDLRHVCAGEFAALRYMESGIAGMVTDGLVCDVVALERLRFPVFSRGVSTAVVRPLGAGRPPEGAVNVPLKVGGVLVSPGDMILADDDGVMVATPEEAREHLAFCREMTDWETYARAEMASGRLLSDIAGERESFRKRFYEKAGS